MAGYPRISENRKVMLIGMASKMYHAGRTPEEIASATKRPIEEVNDWIENIIKVADENRKKMNG